jgi:hypothetical protein
MVFLLGKTLLCAQPSHSSRLTVRCPGEAELPANAVLFREQVSRASVDSQLQHSALIVLSSSCR